MLIIKRGYPERSDLVICTVIKIQFSSIFVRLDEYKNIQGIIHISEISPGRIRNIRDYVKEGKVIVCLVLRVNRERDLIELSLRRVTDTQRRKKINGMKQEQKAAKLIEFVAKSAKADPAELTQRIVGTVSKEYDYVHDFFEDVVTGNETIDYLKLEKSVSGLLEETIRQRIKPPEVMIRGRFQILTHEPDGIETIKAALARGCEQGGEGLAVTYSGAGKYDVTLKAEDYKSAEKALETVADTVCEAVRKGKGQCSFERTDR